jgi:protein-tyrosine phosphatase
VTFVPVACGAIALGHRPRKRSLAAMRSAGLTHVVTLLAESEGAREVGDAVVAAGLEWIWVPLRGADPPPPESDDALREKFDLIERALCGGGHILIHCSAGIHRTGMFAYGLLRHLGSPPEVARSTLAQLRPLTAEGVGDARLEWGDRMG